MEMSSKADKAQELFLAGYNCSQAVAGAFVQELEVPFDTAMRMTSSLGGGMGRLREVCGAVSAAFLVAGSRWGVNDPGNDEAKALHYRRIQHLADRFQERYCSIVCRDLLASFEVADAGPAGNPAPRTPAYYQERPCLGIVRWAAEILEQELASN